VVQSRFNRRLSISRASTAIPDISTWLSRIAHQRRLMKLRKKHRLLDVSLDESAETEEPSARIEVEDQGPSPEQLYAQQNSTNSFRGHGSVNPGMRKQSNCRSYDERSTERPLESWEFPSAR